MTIFHYKLLGFLLIAGLLGFNSFRYWRRRKELRLALAQGDGLARDGWLTTADEPGYRDLYNDLQREAFTDFGSRIFHSIGLAVSWGLLTLVADNWHEWGL